MKIRLGFVSNSSSTSFTVSNKADVEKTLVDFVKENPHLIEAFVEQYDWYKPEDGYNQESLLKSAEANNIIFPPHWEKICTFGDEDGTLIGQVFDYILRDGGKSENFEWSFYEYNR